MLDLNQTKIQRNIEYHVTNGLGFNSQTEYVYDYLIYKDIFSEEDYQSFSEKVKDSNNGLNLHLAEMNLDKELQKIRNKYSLGKKKPGFLNKFFAKLDLLKTGLSINRLREEATDNIIKSMGGLKDIYLKKIVNDALYYNHI